MTVLALVVGATGAIRYWAQRRSLWEDEVIAITHAFLPLPGFFVEVLRNDVHPFLYFLFLKAWSAFSFGSDRWVLASSLACAFASLLTLSWVAYRVHGVRAALWCAAIFAVLPNFAWAAGNLRMYAAIPALTAAT